MPDVEVTIAPREMIGVDMVMDMSEWVGYKKANEIANKVNNEGEKQW